MLSPSPWSNVVGMTTMDWVFIGCYDSLNVWRLGVVILVQKSASLGWFG
jgi:hypothetical protein